MTRYPFNRPLGAAVSVIVAAVLTACGGGGGSSTSAELLAITDANSDSVSHAAAASVVSLGSTGAAPLASQSSSGDVRTAFAAGAALRGSWKAYVIEALTDSARTQRLAARTELKRPLAMIGPISQGCSVSGTMSVMLDDRDGNSMISMGDVMSITFTDCRETAQETISGSMTMTVLAADPAGTSVTADLEMSRLTDTTLNHSISLDGTVRFVYSTSSLSSPLETTEMTAHGPVVARLSTHLPYTDTVTLQDGWHETSEYDDSVPPRTGNVEYGKMTLRVNGSFKSAKAGGTVSVSMPMAAVSYGEDAYPRAGELLVEGAQSALRLKALSPDRVQIDLDANGDGTYESSKTESWDWLL